MVLPLFSRLAPDKQEDSTRTLNIHEGGQLAERIHLTSTAAGGSGRSASSGRRASAVRARKILVIDVGGTHIKLLSTGMKQPIKIPSGPRMTAAMMITKVKSAMKGKSYEVVTIGYPAPVVHGRALREPYNLGGGWVGFDFRKALHRPVKIINDAAMQALGSYRGGRMLFLGLGTGLGSAMIVDGVLQPMELAHLPYKHGKTYEDYLGVRGLKRLGRRQWQQRVYKVVADLCKALQAEEVVLGGGNAKKLKDLPPKVLLGSNDNAFRGGFRLWVKASPTSAT